MTDDFKIPPKQNRDRFNSYIDSNISKFNHNRRSIPSSFTLWKDADVIYAENNIGGNDLYGEPDIDDGKVIQDAINATFNNAGGLIYYKNGVYNSKDLIIGKNNVSHLGETRGDFDDYTQGVTLNYIGNSEGEFFDFENARYFSIENLKLWNHGNATVGLRIGGSENNNEKSKTTHVRNIVIDSFPTGILGSVVGPDNLSYYDTFIGHCDTCCIDHHGSLLFYGGALYASPNAIGVRSYRIPQGTFPDAGMWFFGTTWSTVGIAIDASGEDSLRPNTFYSCWFEVIKKTLLNTQNATITPSYFLGSYRFHNCVGYTDVTATSFMDLRGVNIDVEWEGGEIWTQNLPEYVKTSGVGNTIQTVSFKGVSIGIDRLVFDDEFPNDWIKYFHGLRFKNHLIFPIFSGSSTDTGIVSSSWEVADSIVVPKILLWSKWIPLRFRAVIQWTPNSEASGVRLRSGYGGEDIITTIESSTSGYRHDEVEVELQGYGYPDYIWVDWHGDGENSPSVSSIDLICEW